MYSISKSGLRALFFEFVARQEPAHENGHSFAEVMDAAIEFAEYFEVEDLDGFATDLVSSCFEEMSRTYIQESINKEVAK